MLRAPRGRAGQGSRIKQGLIPRLTGHTLGSVRTWLWLQPNLTLWSVLLHFQAGFRVQSQLQGCSPTLPGCSPPSPALGTLGAEASALSLVLGLERDCCVCLSCGESCWHWVWGAGAHWGRAEPGNSRAGSEGTKRGWSTRSSTGRQLQG